MSHRDDENPLHSPVPYDVMLELATQLGGRYVEWMREAEGAQAREHWRAEQFRVMREVRGLRPRVT